MDDLTSSEFSPPGGFDGSNQAADVPASGFIFGSKLTLVTDPDSLMAESLRSLRTVLLTHHDDAGRDVPARPHRERHRLLPSWVRIARVALANET